MRMLNTPNKYVIHLRDGGAVTVWADAAEGLAGPEDERDYRFVNLMDVSPEDQPLFDIHGRTPTDPERVIVTVALIPRSVVSHVS